MIHKPIYPPKARAHEYGDLAVNSFRGCTHGCTYCFAPGALRMTREDFNNARLRPDIVESVKRQLEREQITGKLIHLCFTCDPYPADIDTTPTREIIQLIKASGNNVQILTKGGKRAERDFDLLTAGDWFGVTLTGADNLEPQAAPNAERYATINAAHAIGIKTWVSFEPVIHTALVYEYIEYSNAIDLYRIGKLNHATTSELKAIHNGIDWATFGQKCIELCEQSGRAYYIKDDLQAEITKRGIERACCPNLYNESGGAGNET